MTSDGPAPGPVLVVGYGNPLRTDDGAGPAVADALAGDPRMAGVDVRSAHQLTPELALDASGASLLVLVDAADGPSPGEVTVRRVEAPGEEHGGSGADHASEPPMTHHLDPEALLGLARELFGAAPPTVVVSVGVESLEVGEDLTPAVADGVRRAARLVVDLVEEHRRA